MIANPNSLKILPAVDRKRDVQRVELDIVLDIQLDEIIAKQVEPLPPDVQSVRLLVTVVKAELQTGGQRRHDGASHVRARLRERQNVEVATPVARVQGDALAYLCGKQVKPHVSTALNDARGGGPDAPATCRPVRRETATFALVHHRKLVPASQPAGGCVGSLLVRVV